MDWRRDEVWFVDPGFGDLIYRAYRIDGKPPTDDERDKVSKAVANFADCQYVILPGENHG